MSASSNRCYICEVEALPVDGECLVCEACQASLDKELEEEIQRHLAIGVAVAAQTTDKPGRRFYR